MSLLDLCKAIEQTTISSIVRESAFPYVEGAHVLGLSLSVGTVLWFDLRLLGAAMRLFGDDWRASMGRQSS